jgi:hypothetical protein
MSTLRALLREVLPGASEQNILDILRLRCVKPDIVKELVFMHDDLRDFLDRDEHKELQKSKEAVLAENEGEESFTAEFQTYNRTVRAAAAKAAAKGRAKGNSKKRLAVRAPEFLDESLTEEYLQSWMPPSHRVWRDAFCCRWQWCFGRQYMGSKSWLKYGYCESAKATVREAWTYEVFFCR